MIRDSRVKSGESHALVEEHVFSVLSQVKPAAVKVLLQAVHSDAGTVIKRLEEVSITTSVVVVTGLVSLVPY
jgi:hypothetical protein